MILPTSDRPRVRDVTLLGNRALAQVEPLRRREARRPFSEAFSGRAVLEIGGPSALFSSGGLLPLYSGLKQLDSCNYAPSTIWDGDQPGVPTGETFIAEAAQLPMQDGRYEGLLASHVLEHVADAISTLREWRRVVSPRSPLLIVVPHRDMTFDHRRPTTTIEHFEEDFVRKTGEDDLTHLPEILALNDGRHDHFDGDADAFRRRGEDNLRVRALHHHVFTTETLFRLLAHAGLSVESLVVARPYHIAALCRAPEPGAEAEASERTLAHALRQSPFPSDHR